ncbi:hypothetical protein J7E87_26080 [Streptomyces sp. ISL-1]|uniref:hypothetical protein n=1 Tax=Streptomyces sp. ISL-1 TaxID=2817657 RepID=UPI001BEA0BF2|nr:hypothetical protein [Streptomyces sp. ISL-1]MBT2392808.1 hypothetical protein [Streptomyces sp. ISL-1]
MGDKPDLKVDYDLLIESETSLTNIQREFKKCGSRQGELAEDVGARTMENAMHEFAENWKDNRKQMLQNLEDVLKLVTTARESFEKIDNEQEKQAKGKDKK